MKTGQPSSLSKATWTWRVRPRPAKSCSTAWGTSTLLVDLSAVTYIDSSGIASLVESFQKARKAGGHFALVAVSGSVLSVLQLSRLDKVFTMYDTLEDGLARAG